MPAYRVTGTIQEYATCTCEFCEGHLEKRKVSKIIVADSQDVAAENVLSAFSLTIDAEWVAGDPDILELGEDILMRAADQPELFPT